MDKNLFYRRVLGDPGRCRYVLNESLDKFRCVNQYDPRGLFTCKLQEGCPGLRMHQCAIATLAYFVGKSSFSMV